MAKRRIVVKIGSSSLTDSLGEISIDKMGRFTKGVAALQLEHQCQVIVVSSGAVAAGLGKLKWNRAAITVPEKQAAAAIGQGLLVKLYERLLDRHGITVAQVLLTKSDMDDRKRFVHIRNTVETLLKHDVIPVVNENDTVAVEEIRFGDNDTLASQVALVADADLVILLTDIDSLYDADPRVDRNARPISDVWKITNEMENKAGSEGSNLGTGGMLTKLAAARIGMESGIDVVVASSNEADVLQRIIQGEHLGTTFHADVQGLPLKKSWIAHSARLEGRLVIDEGAVHALLNHAASLLVPGIVDITGEFQEGAIVQLVTRGGKAVAKGATGISSSDLRILLRRKLAGEFVTDSPEVVHRNHMALVREEHRV